MIRVTVELLPGGKELDKEVLGIGTIALLEAKDKGRLGTYHVRLSKRGKHQDRLWRKGEVRDFPRKRLGGWDLLYLALRDIVGERNP